MPLPTLYHFRNPALFEHFKRESVSFLNQTSDLFFFLTLVFKNKTKKGIKEETHIPFSNTLLIPEIM